MTVRILLVEDHGLVRSGIRSLLADCADLEIVGEAGDGHAALTAAAATHPDVVLLDLSLPALHGLEVLRRVLEAQTGVRVLVLSMHREVEYVARALALGAAGYLVKDTSREELVDAVRAVARGGRHVSRGVPRKSLEAYLAQAPDHPLDRLTSRQREVLQLVAEGLTTREIAARLGISTKTVEVHRAHIMQRLDIHDLAGLVRFAVSQGLVSSES